MKLVAKSKKKVEVKKRILSFKRVICGVVIFSFLILAVLIISYNLYFNGDITSDHERWAQFGSFFGGVLTPIFSLFTFIGFLTTIAMQKTELKNSYESIEISKRELKKTEESLQLTIEYNDKKQKRETLEKMLNMLHEELNKIYSKKVDFFDNDYLYRYFEDTKIFFEMPENEDNMSITDRDSYIIQDLISAISDINTCIDEYEGNFGKSSLTYYYKKKHHKAVRELIKKGYVSEMGLKSFKHIGYHYSYPAKEK